MKNVYMVIISKNTETTSGETYPVAIVVPHVDQRGDIRPMMDGIRDLLSVRICTTLSEAKRCAAEAGVDERNIQVLHSGN